MFSIPMHFIQINVFLKKNIYTFTGQGHHIRNAPTMFLPGRMAFEFDTELELLGPSWAGAVTSRWAVESM